MARLGIHRDSSSSGSGQVAASDKKTFKDGDDVENGREPEQETIVDQHEIKYLARALKQRHIQMIALAGAIGTGLFLGLGSALQTAGPLGALLAYALVGLIVCAVQFAIGEVSALFPITGSYVRHAELLVDPALGFAVGWNMIYGVFVGVPAEITAATVLIEFWTSKYQALWITLFILATFIVGIAFVGIYGEVEFFFTTLKVLLIVGIIMMGLVIDLGGVPGQDRIGFRYWKDPGPFVPFIVSGSLGKFLGFWAVLSRAIYSFSGVESISIPAAETINPRQNIPKAAKRIFARITLFYLLAVLIVGMVVPSNDPDLSVSTGTATQSPFVIAATRAGISGVPHIINAVVLTSAWSASNQGMLVGTRIIYALALKGQAPKIFLRTTKFGIPYIAVIVQTLASTLAYMALSNKAYTVFIWFLQLTASSSLITWITILVNHIRLHQALKKQGISRHELPWSNWWTPYASRIALAACVLLLLTSGFTVFIHGYWSSAGFISSYLDIPLVLVAFAGWKLFKKTKWIPLEDIPIRQALDEMLENPEQKNPVPKGIQRLNFLWG